MPSIKDHEAKKKKKHPQAHQGHSKKQGASHASERLQADEAEQGEDLNSAETEVKPKVEKRRPSQLDADAVETKGQSNGGTEEYQTSSKAHEESVESGSDESSGSEAFQSFSEGEKFELNFPGSFILKTKAPKVFELAERVAGDWIHDGSFEALPVGHPLAQILAAKALTKAKSIEKNVLNSAPVTLAKIGLEYAKSKIKR